MRQVQVRYSGITRTRAGLLIKNRHSSRHTSSLPWWSPGTCWAARTIRLHSHCWLLRQLFEIGKKNFTSQAEQVPSKNYS